MNMNIYILQYVLQEINSSWNMTGCFSVTPSVEKVFILPDDDING